MIRPIDRTRVRTLAALLLAGALALTGCAGGAETGGDLDGKQLLTIPREDLATFTRNFNPFSPNAAPMTQQAIYEPMMVFNPADSTTTPWLATEWKEAKDGTGITFTLREGVKWSDGEPFTADDVAYTFELKKEVAGGFEYVDTVEATDEHTVEFDFNTAFAPALYEIGQQIIVPEHVWSQVDDPAKETNETPVGTGPYTEVTNFQSQSYELRKNPEYWQPDRQKIEGIRMLAFAGNDPANLATTNGETDWADQFIPNIEDAFVAKDPEHRHYWFPPIDAMINWQLNTTKAPFDDVEVRKALSMAIDRETITKVAMQDYTHPADCTGLSGSYEHWRDESVVEACDWTTRDVDAANSAARRGGLPDGRRRDPDQARRVAVPLRHLRRRCLVGLALGRQHHRRRTSRTSVSRPRSSLPTGRRSWPATRTGASTSGIVWSNNEPTPYQFYRGAMSTTTVMPVGEQATQNYHRFGLTGSRRPARRVRQDVRPCRPGEGGGRAAGTVLGERPGDPAVPRPAVGCLQHHAVHRLPGPGQPVRHLVHPYADDGPGVDHARARRQRMTEAPTAG